MHEMAWARRLVRQVTSIAQAQGARRVTGVTVRLGPHAGLSAERVREHFVAAARNTPAEGAALTVRDPDAGGAWDTDTVLESLEVEG